MAKTSKTGAMASVPEPPPTPATTHPAHRKKLTGERGEKAEIARDAIKRLQAEVDNPADITPKRIIEEIGREYGQEVAEEEFPSSMMTRLREELGLPKLRGGGASAGGGEEGATSVRRGGRSAAASSGPAYAGIGADLMRVMQLAKKYGGAELLELSRELPRLVAKFGEDEFARMVEMLGEGNGG